MWRNSFFQMFFNHGKNPAKQIISPRTSDVKGYYQGSTSDLQKHWKCFFRSVWLGKFVLETPLFSLLQKKKHVLFDWNHIICSLVKYEIYYINDSLRWSEDERKNVDWAGGNPAKNRPTSYSPGSLFLCFCKVWCIRSQVVGKNVVAWCRYCDSIRSVGLKLPSYLSQDIPKSCPSTDELHSELQTSVLKIW